MGRWRHLDRADPENEPDDRDVVRRLRDLMHAGHDDGEDTAAESVPGEHVRQHLRPGELHGTVNDVVKAPQPTTTNKIDLIFFRVQEEELCSGMGNSRWELPLWSLRRCFCSLFPHWRRPRRRLQL